MDNDTIVAKGVSGIEYTFSIYPWGTDLQKMGGVYIILKKADQKSDYTILYVGQTGDLSEDFDNHPKKPCFDRNGKTHIAILPESFELNRQSIESDLIRSCNPVCNL
jgi:hypothetical protein